MGGAIEHEAAMEGIRAARVIQSAAAASGAASQNAQSAAQTITTAAVSSEQLHKQTMRTMEYDETAVHVAQLCVTAAAVDVEDRLRKAHLGWCHGRLRSRTERRRRAGHSRSRNNNSSSGRSCNSSSRGEAS